MPNGWSFNWKGMVTKERECLETRCAESFLVVYVCILAISNKCQKTFLLREADRYVDA
jgi:hypothetical protein